MTVWLALLLAALALAVYAPAARFDFVNLDDPEYVTANPPMQAGLSRAGIRWVFSSIHVGNWHPLTGLSLLLDNQLFGLNPHGYHLTSILLHALNAALLFLLLRGMTGALWRSAFVAALFAVHPQHVESVAWIAIRKDPLSLLFGLLTLIAYARFAKRPSARMLALALAAYAAALMAKPMMVSLPVLMLLLDAWPLRRAAGSSGGSVELPLPPESGGGGGARPDACPPPAEKPLAVRDEGQAAGSGVDLPLWPRLREKIPFILLAAAACGITLVVQQRSGAVKSLDQFPLDTRLANALTAYLLYLARAVWPVNLACYYPYPAHVPLAPAIAAGALLIAITAAAAWQRRRRPYLAAGWLWCLVALLPVIGLVQVGRQALADRYAYLPLIGIYLAAAWGWADLVAAVRRVASGRAARILAVGAPLIALAVLAVGARRQVMTWRDSTALFIRALTVTRDNDFILNNYGDVLFREGRTAEALAAFREAVRINPNYAKARHNLGAVLAADGALGEAAEHLEAALALDPWFLEALTKLADVRVRLGQRPAAIELYRRAVAVRPDSLEARNNLGVVLMDEGRHDDARRQFRAALGLDPGSATLRYNLALNEAQAGRTAEAIRQYQTALRLYPAIAPVMRPLLDRLAARPDLAPAERETVELLMRDSRLGTEK